VKTRQILVNILGNAGKFTEKGTIRFSAFRRETDGRDWLTFAVQDTGIGIVLLPILS
jgi:signal transduction histidine kinase